MSIKKEVTKELIKKHGSNEADSGSSGSQVSILTERINNITIHLNENKKDLIDWFEKGCKSEESFKIGTEHEKFVYKTSNLSPVTYDEESGICNILKSLTRFGWQEVKEGNNLIALKKDEQSITLEPGGQLELSGAPLDNIHKTCREVYEHLEQVKEVGNELNVGFLGIGSRIEGKLANHYWMPKERYKIMKAYMPKVGRLGLDMMADTCTVQVNLDYSSEEESGVTEDSGNLSYSFLMKLTLFQITQCFLV